MQIGVMLAAVVVAVIEQGRQRLFLMLTTRSLLAAVFLLEHQEQTEILLQSLEVQALLPLLALGLYPPAAEGVLEAIFFLLKQVAMVVLEAVDQVCLLLQEVQHRHLVKGLLVATVLVLTAQHMVQGAEVAQRRLAQTEHHRLAVRAGQANKAHLTHLLTEVLAQVVHHLLVILLVVVAVVLVVLVVLAMLMGVLVVQRLLQAFLVLPLIMQVAAVVVLLQTHLGQPSV